MFIQYTFTFVFVECIYVGFIKQCDVPFSSSSSLFSNRLEAHEYIYSDIK